MALTFTKQPADTPSGTPDATYLYPAFNDAYLEFSSDAASNFEGQIIVTDLASQQFSVHRDLEGKYLFNLKEIVKTLINSDGFKDQADTPTSPWGVSYPYGYFELDLTVRAKYPTDQYDSLAKTYYFQRGVKQIGETVSTNEAQLLQHSENGIDYSLTYWEGFPFSFELQKIAVDAEINVISLNSGDESAVQAPIAAGSFTIGLQYQILTIGTTDYTLIGAASNTVGLVFEATGVGTGTGTANLYSPLVQSATSSYRLWVDDGTGDNWTTTGFLPLSDTQNRLEIEIDSVFKTNVNIKQKFNCAGVYVKWYNEDGGYSYHLFDEYYRDTVRGKSVGTIGANDFNNVADGLIAPTVSLGIQASHAYRLKTTADAAEVAVLRSLFTSPSVQMWSSQERYTGGEWIDVTITPNYKISNKKALNEITATVFLPELITPKL